MCLQHARAQGLQHLRSRSTSWIKSCHSYVKLSVDGFHDETIVRCSIRKTRQKGVRRSPADCGAAYRSSFVSLTRLTAQLYLLVSLITDAYHVRIGGEEALVPKQIRIDCITRSSRELQDMINEIAASLHCAMLAAVSPSGACRSSSFCIPHPFVHCDIDDERRA
nr:hypothetical protein CFP56_09580 [Quercus suber]